MMLRFGGGGGSRVTDGGGGGSGGGGGTSGQLLRQHEAGGGGGGVDNGKNFTVARLRSLYAELLDGVTPPADEVGGGDDVGRADPWSPPPESSAPASASTGRGSGGMGALGRSLSSRGRGLGVGRGGSLNRSRQTKKRERISNAIPPSARAAAWRILSATGEGLGTGTGGGSNGMKTSGANNASRDGRRGGGGGAGSATNAELRDDATAAALAVARSMEVRLVEVLRSIAEVVVYGEQNLHSLAGTEVFEYFCDKNLMALLVDIARSRPPGCVTGGGGGSIGGHPHPPPRFRGVVHTAAVKAQVLQTASILVANVQHPTSLYYLLSNDCVNDLVLSLVPLRQFTNAALEELMPVYISFLKSLALNLVSSPELLPFFLGRTKAQRRRSGTDSTVRARESSSPGGTTATTFPLFAAAVEVATSPFASNDTFVRTTALNIVLNTCQIADDSVRGVVGGESTSSEQRTLFAHLCHRMVRTYLLIVNLTVGPVVGRRSRCDALAGEMADLQDQMQFLNDLLRCGVRPLNVRLCEWLLRRVVFPLLGNVMCGASASSSSTSTSAPPSSTSSAVGVSPRKHAGGGTAVVGPDDSPPRWEAASIGPRKILSMDSSFTELHQQATPNKRHLRKTKGGGGGVGDGITGSGGEGTERDEEELSTSTAEDASEDGSDSDDGGEEDADGDGDEEDGSPRRSNGLHRGTGGGDDGGSTGLNEGTSRQSSISRLEAIGTCTEWSESEARSQVALFVLAQMVRNIDYIPLVRMIAVAALHPLSPRRLSGECGGDGDCDDDARDGGGTSRPSSDPPPSPAAAGHSDVVENEFTITQELNDVVQDRYVHMSATAVAADGLSVDGTAAASPQPPPPSPPPSDESKGEGSVTEEGEDASQTDTDTETDTATGSTSYDDGRAQPKSPPPNEEAEEDAVGGIPTDGPSTSGDYGTPPESPAPPPNETEEYGSTTDSASDEETSDEAEGSDHRPLSSHEERSSSHSNGQRPRSSGVVVVVPSPYRDELLRLLSGDAGDARFIPAAIFLQNLIESEAIDEGILLSLHVLPVGVNVEHGTSGGGDFEAGKNAPLPASSSASASSCSTGGGSGRSHPGRGVDCDTATSSDLENSMSNFFSRGHAWGSNHSIVAIKVAASLALFLIPRTISTMSKSDGGIDRLRRWFRSSPLLRGLVRARANLATDATTFRRSPGVADLFVDLMESEIARRYSPKKGSNAQLGAERLVRFPVRVVTEYSLVRRGPDDDVGAGNEVEQARFAIRLMLHMRSVCNVVRDVRGAFRRDWQEHKTVTGDTLAPLRTYDEADEDMLTIGGLKERPAVGSDLELKGRTFFSFSASWQELDKMRSKTTLGAAKKDLLIVVDPTILYIVKKRSSGNEDNSRGKILCAAPLRSIIATATDEDLWLHLAVRPTENVGMSLNNESMSFRFDSLGNLLVVREHLDRCRSLLISQMLEKTDLLLEACNKDLSVEL